MHPTPTPATPTSPAVSSAPSPARRWTVLAVCASALFLVGLDTTAVTVALPAVGAGLGVTPGNLSWVVDAYTVAFAGLLITSGSLADRFGRRRVFRTGLTLFAAASLVCAVAPTFGILVAARALQGIGASMLSPVALAIVVTMITDPRERALATGVWGSMFGLSMAAGPVTGGALADAVGWRAVFWINIPLVLLALVLVACVVPESRALHPRRPDLPGQILLAMILVCGVGLLIEGPQFGWTSPLPLVAVPVLGAAIVLFVRVESGRREPLVNPALFRSLSFAGAVGAAVAVFTAFSMTLFLTTGRLQDFHGWTAVGAGSATLPMAFGAFTGAPASGYLMGKVGAGTPLLLSGGCLLGGGVVLILSTGGDDLHLLPLLASYLLIGTGVGLSSSPITTTAVNSLPADRAGVAGGVTSTARQVGTALGAAVAGSLTTTGVTGMTVITVCSVPVIVVGVLVTVADRRGR